MPTDTCVGSCEHAALLARIEELEHVLMHSDGWAVLVNCVDPDGDSAVNLILPASDIHYVRPCASLAFAVHVVTAGDIAYQADAVDYNTFENLAVAYGTLKTGTRGTA